MILGQYFSVLKRCASKMRRGQYFSVLVTFIFLLTLFAIHERRSRQNIEHAYYRAVIDLQTLQEQASVLITTVSDMTSKLQICEGEKLNLEADIMKIKGNDKGPSLEEEKSRREVERSTIEFLRFMYNKISSLQLSTSRNMMKEDKQILNDIQEFKLKFKSDMYSLANNVTNHEVWRKKESQRLGNLVQRRLEYLQNPKECKSAKKLVYRLRTDCGFGCQLHHITACLITAYATGRTLIVQSEGWRYANKGWTTTFLPLGKNCAIDQPLISWRETAERLIKNIRERNTLRIVLVLTKLFSNTNEKSINLRKRGLSRLKDAYLYRAAGSTNAENDQVLEMTGIGTITAPPYYFPLAVPEDLVDKILRFHGDPAVWWIGQFVKYITRPNKDTTDLLNRKRQSLSFKNPIIGVHIRRTDKLRSEAQMHTVEEYMIYVKEWYDIYEKREPGVKRRVYIASDDSGVLTEAIEKYPQYIFISDKNASFSAALERRYSEESLRGIIQDIKMLSMCDYLVCTFSSGVCKAAYELMQTHHGDASQRFRSLDDIYYFNGQNMHRWRSIESHQGSGRDELTLNKGDIIKIYGNHWNGFSKGQNLRSAKVGLFPSYKAVDIVERVKMPTYPEVPEI